MSSNRKTMNRGKSKGMENQDELGTIFQAYLDDCRIRNLARVTIDAYTIYLRTFFGFCNMTGIDPLAMDDDGLLAFIKYVREDRRNCHKSLRNVFCALSSFYQYLLFSKRIVHNPIPHISKRYLRSYKNEGERSEKNILTVKEMARMISMISDVRDQALFMVLAKTGVRRNELITLDVEDVDLKDGRITLKPTNKRSNKVLFIDKECIKALGKWLEVRGTNSLESKALFTNKHGRRIHRCDLYDTVVKWAERAGYHNPNSKKKADRFYPHCFRHWFTTHLIRNGMPRDFVKELRGDARREAIDLYNHIDKELLKKCYLDTMPKLSIKIDNK